MKKLPLILLAILGCQEIPPSSDQVQAEQQERILAEGTSQVGMPNIKNFRERKILKDILEMRDQEGLATYTYLFSESTGKLTFFCHSIGYGIPYATQYTSPQKIQRTPLHGGGYNLDVMPQADPNGLFSPSSADGTWVLCKDPNSKKVAPVLVEPRTVFSPFPLEVDPTETKTPEKAP